MPTIFISYRRADAAGQAGRLADRLRACFGVDSVFRDYEAIELGADFDRSIRDALSGCAVVIPVIGTSWTDVTDDAGQRRLENPEDYVRQEIEYALEHDIPLMPVLVDGATVPVLEQLPEALTPLQRRQMQELREARWDDDVTALMRQIQQECDLTADCPELKSASPMRDAVVHFFRDVLDLHARPVRFLVRHNTGRLHEVHRAIVFFLCAVLIGDIALFGSTSWKEKGWIDLLTGVLSGIPPWFALCMLFAVSLWVSWWLVGTRAHFRKVLTNALYQTGFLALLVLFAFWFLIIGAGVSKPNFLEDALALALATPGAQRTERLLESFADISGPALFIGLVLASLILLDVLVWIVRAWGAHRAVLQKSRWHSAAALLLMFVMLGTSIGFPAWVGLVAG